MAARAKRVEINERTMVGYPRKVAETVPTLLYIGSPQMPGASNAKRARFVLEKRGSELEAL